VLLSEPLWERLKRIAFDVIGMAITTAVNGDHEEKSEAILTGLASNGQVGPESQNG